MIIIPAIDLLNGSCVRLVRGEYSTAHKVAADALETAREFIAAGAQMLHVVDLDGARDGSRTNAGVIEKLCALGVPVQTGGGIRDMNAVERCLSSGASRVVIGSAAVEDEDFLRRAVEKHAKAVAVGVDCQDGYLKTRGWRESTKVHYSDFVRKITDMGVRTVIYTDISRDGTLEGAALGGLAEVMAAAGGADVIASGGVRDLSDIDALLKLGVSGVICGKSIYSGTLDLKAAITRAQNYGK